MPGPSHRNERKTGRGKRKEGNKTNVKAIRLKRKMPAFKEKEARKRDHSKENSNPTARNRTRGKKKRNIPGRRGVKEDQKRKSAALKN